MSNVYGYEITTADSDEYKGWTVATAINEDKNTWTWGHGESEEEAIGDCLFSIRNNEVFDGKPSDY